MLTIENILLFYLMFINIIGFALMGIDKQKARKRKYRIPEKTLFLSAIIGGSIGSNLGMYVFHHKTKHVTFVIGMPIILLLQIMIFIYCIKFV